LVRRQWSGSGVTIELAWRHPDRLLGIHLSAFYLKTPPPPWRPAICEFFAARERERVDEGAYSRMQDRGRDPVSARADEEFTLFPREIAPRLHDALVSIYRRASFEPRVRNESFHTGWDLGVLVDIPSAALARTRWQADSPTGSSRSR
jgi:hypothetical protein